MEEDNSDERRAKVLELAEHLNTHINDTCAGKFNFEEVLIALNSAVLSQTHGFIQETDDPLGCAQHLINIFYENATKVITSISEDAVAEAKKRKAQNAN